MRANVVVCCWLCVFGIAASQSSKYNPGKLVVTEQVQRLTMRHNESFERSSTFITYGDLLIVPAAKKPKIGLWSMGKFRATYQGASKTSCKFSKQENYYLPGNNRVEIKSTTVDVCKQRCCEDEMCQSFDFARSGTFANTCYLSNFVEGPSGITWDTNSEFDYYEIVPTEVIKNLGVLTDGNSTLVVGSATHSGNLYQYSLFTSGRPSLSTLGPYVASSAALTGHASTILCLTVAKWASSQILLTGGYDKTLIVWNIQTGSLVVKQRISNFSWPIWAITPGSANEVFVAGDHADISRWVLPATGNKNRGEQAQWLKGHSRLVSCMAFDSTNSIMASGSEDTRIVLWHKKTGGQGNYEFGAKLFDHKDAVKSLTFATPNLQPLLISSGDDGSINIFDPKADDTTCNFEKQLNYYLPGNNRYEFLDTSLAECMKICCEADWCASFDYATKADPAGFHGPNACWMSTFREGASGLTWDGSGSYHYYEVAKRGTKLITLMQPGPVARIDYAASPTNLMLVEHAGDASNPGGLGFIKLTEVKCPDGSAPNFEGTECVDCRLGFAGKGGICNECKPGTYSPKEGSFECVECVKGFASSITDTPSIQMVEDLWGLVKCTECPKWALSTKTGQYFCEWCPPGMLPAADRKSCVGVVKGQDSVAGRSDWTESWHRDAHERMDAFCPQGAQGYDSCMYPPAVVAKTSCPMTCPRSYQVEVDKDWNPKGARSGNLFDGFTTDFDVSWKCLIRNKTAQEMCNKLLCMGSLVSMQGWHEKERCVKDRTDCTCAEELRESCNGGLQRLREDQCRSQCTPRWCDLMCQSERAKEYTGIFRPDNVENPFQVLRCEAKGTECVATCKNEQRRVATTRQCGAFDIWDDDKKKFLIQNDALCGTEGRFEKRQRYRHDRYGSRHGYEEEVFLGVAMSETVCTYGTMQKMRHPQETGFHRQYAPAACVANGALHMVLSVSSLLPVMLAAIAF